MKQQEWFTVQECMGLPGFSRTAPNVRNKLDQLTAGHPELKRKRNKTKAFEYHSSVLPDETKAYLGLHAAPAKAVHYARAQQADPDLELWIRIFNSLNADQKNAIVKIFFAGGIQALMPAVAALADREILQQCSTDENAPPASSISTQDKKVG